MTERAIKNHHRQLLLNVGRQTRIQSFHSTYNNIHAILPAQDKPPFTPLPST